MSLRRRISRHYADWYGVEVDPASVMVVAGASAGFTLAFAAAFDAGDRVAVVEPGYPCYRNTLVALGVEPVAIAVDASTRWAPTVEQLDAACSSGGPLAGLVVASPSNPTGTVLSASALGALAAWCEANGVQLISDEIYHGVVYDGRAETALGSTRSAVVVNSFSKYWSMTGWRLGWMVVPSHLIDTVERLQQNLYICATHVSQVAGAAAFDAVDELDANVARYRGNRTVLLDGLADAGLTDVAPADGAFYVYADVEHLTSRIGGDSLQLCTRWLHELGIACTPGLDFDLSRGPHTVRFSYAGDGGDLRRACERIADWTKGSESP
jgi:aspartate/methionine/tyrosine aminotransferase